MTDPRWTTVDGLFEAALARNPDERPAFLREASAGNETLRQEVESLLAHERAADFLGRPAHELIGGAPDRAHQSFIGRSFGSYRVLGLLGTGGMGEVYRAHDTTLGRDVALKVLPPAFTTDPDRRARFVREAQVLAALNHPHLGAIYGIEETDGIRALVLELVERPRHPAVRVDPGRGAQQPVHDPVGGRRTQTGQGARSRELLVSKIPPWQ